ncbi:MAG: homogentisate phytyltransferase [Bacteroidota bacterium]
MKFLVEFVRFSRLHTVVGTSLSIVALYLIALSYSDLGGLQQFGFLLLTLVSCLGANIYIVGLNQITDVEIDRINKPYLPLASGAFTLQTAYLLVGFSVLLSLALAFYTGQYLLWTVLLSLALGTAYSLPPVRLKRFHFWAAFCIIAVRGLIVNILLFLNFHSNLNGQHGLPPLILLLTGCIFVYSIIIAWFKDLPDTEGDERYEIRTLSIKWGRQSVFRVGVILLSGLYILLMAAPFLFELSVANFAFSLAHLLSFVLLWIANKRLDLEDQSSIRKYYQFIWILFFMEYIVFALTSLLN